MEYCWMKILEFGLGWTGICSEDFLRFSSTKCISKFVCKMAAILSRPRYAKHDDVIKWKHFPRNWPFVRGIHRSPVNFPHKGQWRGALMFSLICVWINDWVNNREASDLRRYRAHYDVIVMDATESFSVVCSKGEGVSHWPGRCWSIG